MAAENLSPITLQFNVNFFRFGLTLTTKRVPECNKTLKLKTIFPQTCECSLLMQEKVYPKTGMNIRTTENIKSGNGITPRKRRIGTM